MTPSRRLHRFALGGVLFAAVLGFASSAGAAPSFLEPPLPRTPYRIIRKAHPKKSEFRVRVAVFSKQEKPQIITPLSPARNDVLAEVCGALERTVFRCMDPKEKDAAPDYLIRIDYDIYLDEFRYHRGLGRIDRDDYPDDLYQFRWSLAVFPPAEESPLYQIRYITKDHRLWNYDLQYWVKRFFSE